MTATEVIGLVIDAMLKMSLVDIGTLRARSSVPNASSYTTRSRVVTSATTPGTSPWAIASRRYEEMSAAPRADRLVDAPAARNCGRSASRTAATRKISRFMRRDLTLSSLNDLRPHFKEQTANANDIVENGADADDGAGPGGCRGRTGAGAAGRARRT